MFKLGTLLILTSLSIVAIFSAIAFSVKTGASYLGAFSCAATFLSSQSYIDERNKYLIIIIMYNNRFKL